MFEVVLCEDKVPIPYHHLKPNHKTCEISINPQIVMDIITQRYNDCVHPGIGLFVDLFDIVRAYECKSLPDVSVGFTRVIFRYIVFNPPIGSVWEAKISSSNEDGIALTLSFFSDIWVPWPNLPHGSEFSATDNIWVYYSQEDSEADPDKLYFDHGDSVRFRVSEVKFSDDKTGPLMQIIGSMSTTGLGPKRWWEDAEEKE